MDIPGPSLLIFSNATKPFWAGILPWYGAIGIDIVYLSENTIRACGFCNIVFFNGLANMYHSCVLPDLTLAIGISYWSVFT